MVQRIVNCDRRKPRGRPLAEWSTRRRQNDAAQTAARPSLQTLEDSIVFAVNRQETHPVTSHSGGNQLTGDDQHLLVRKRNVLPFADSGACRALAPSAGQLGP